MAAAHSDDEDLTAAVEQIAAAMKNGGYPRNGRTKWEAPVSLGQLIVSMLALLVTCVGAVFFDRLSGERRLTEIQERQNAVLNVHIPQLREEITDLRRIDHDRAREVVLLQQENNALRLEIREHFARDTDRFRKAGIGER